MTPGRIISTIFALGFIAFLIKFFVAPAPVEESRSEPIGLVQSFPEGVTSVPEQRIFVVRERGTVYLLLSIDRNTGCRIEWKPAGNFFSDPCSPSRYDVQGDPFKGSPASYPLWRPQIRLDASGRLMMDRSWRLSLPAENVKPLNGNNPVWNQIFDSSLLEADPRRRTQEPFALPLSPK